MKVLFIVDHAPNYRESFFRYLGERVNLHVLAQPCEYEGLTAPESRENYSYREMKSKKFLGLVIQNNVRKVIADEKWDIICVDFNLRHISRLYSFMSYSKYHAKWVWWGHILGSKKNIIISFVRGYFLKRAAGVLAYSNEIVKELKKKYLVESVCSNNAQYRLAEFTSPYFDNHSEINLLYVGRNSPRKNLRALIGLAHRLPFIHVKLIGPGMDQIILPEDLKNSGRFSTHDELFGPELDSYFKWADLVVNPGHLGLLAVNAAVHGKGIVVDAESNHAPEYLLPKDSKQPFISFKDHKQVDAFFIQIKNNRDLLYEWAVKNQSLAKSRYSIEWMVDRHIDCFKDIYSANKKS